MRVFYDNFEVMSTNVIWNTIPPEVVVIYNTDVYGEYTLIDNLKIWHSVESEYPSWEWNNGNGINIEQKGNFKA